MELVSADKFSLQELTDAYNQTRIDYIVPMPMNVSRLKEYISLYDVDLSASWVAIRQGEIFGLGMLGVREGRSWITRVGVLPKGRRRGTGRALINRLLKTSRERDSKSVWIEVILGNIPAKQLFLSSGFEATRELVVARRPPDHTGHLSDSSPKSSQPVEIKELSKLETLYLAASQTSRSNWLLETESLANIPDLCGMYARFEGDSSGWAAYHVNDFQITHVVVGCLTGDPSQVTAAILRYIHRCYPTQDAVMQNLPATDPRWKGFKQAGYFDVFRRSEMVRNLG